MIRKKRSIKIDLNQYEFDLFKEAVNTLTRYPDAYMQQDLAKNALTSFCVAVIKQGACGFPTAVNLRFETKVETDMRLAGQIPVRGCESSPQYHYLSCKAAPENVTPLDFKPLRAGRN